MGIMNARNAFVGWLVIKFARLAIEKKVKEAMPGSAGSRLRIPLISAGGVAAAAAAVVLLRRRLRAVREVLDGE